MKDTNLELSSVLLNMRKGKKNEYLFNSTYVPHKYLRFFVASNSVGGLKDGTNIDSFGFS